jgi:hypothetical protein
VKIVGFFMTFGSRFFILILISPKLSKATAGKMHMSYTSLRLYQA